MKARLTFEYDGKVEKIWTLHCGIDQINTFELLKMGYINETYLKDIAKQFDPSIEIEEDRNKITSSIKLLEWLRSVDDNVIDNKILQLKKNI